MKHILPELPYAIDALEPILSAETLEYHYKHHHKGYVDKLNKLIEDSDFEKLTLEQIVGASTGAVFNNAAQAWNHSFLWNSLCPPKHYREPSGAFSDAIRRDFGSLDDFGDEFTKAAADVFGSGWAWLVFDHDTGSLLVETTPNAENPLARASGRTPLLTCDVWEHAYYLDYRNERAKYVKSLLEILNWRFAERGFETVMAREVA